MKTKIVVITGAFGVLGNALVQALQFDGIQVIALDYSSTAPDTLQVLVDKGVYIRGGFDIADPAVACGVARDIVEHVGMPDALLNIAGGFAWETLSHGDVATWGRLFRINVETAVSACKAFLPYLRESSGGRIINIGAAAAVKAGAGMGPYAASKSGVMRFTESLAEELKADTSITVNAILPSILDTPANRSDMPDADYTRWVTPEDICATVRFLLRPEAGAINGALIPVTGRI
ncbi:MAG TPA: SDR family NAD(P)-dependent oxidoreductase [Pseudomonas sp.]|nr:SDR family NAD(P)-dependent oxidoreductase [Pseudomonas sp.]